MKNRKGITLIALVITIVILIILSAVTINLTIGENGIFNKAKYAKEKTNYTSAKEIILLNITEAQMECISKEKTFEILDIAELMKQKSNVTIEKYYNSETALIKEGVSENMVNLKGIVVSVNDYSKYKFLIGKSCDITGILDIEIDESTNIEEFREVLEYENERFKEQIVVKPDEPIDSSKLYLYKEGNEYEQITGGWGVGFLTGTTSEVGSATKYDKYIEFKTWGYWCAYAMTTTKSIDSTGYSKLCVEVYDTSWENISGGYDQFVIAYAGIADILYTTQILDTIYVEDISSIQGEGIIYIQFANGANGKVKAVWLEK